MCSKSKKWINPLRITALLAALAMIFSVGAGMAESGETPEELTLDSYSGSLYGAEEILLAGDYLLGEGKDPAAVAEEMRARADAMDMAVSFRWLSENIAAKANPDYGKIRALLGGEEEYRRLDIYDRGAWQVDSDYSFTPTREVECSEKLAALLKDDGAEYCFPASWWYEDEFASALGVSFEKFRPSRPRPGYVCVVVKSGAESYPERAWDDENYGYMLRDHLATAVAALQDGSEDALPQLTGNPNLASQFWVFDQGWTFIGIVGSEGRSRGYDARESLTVLKADTRETVGEWSLEIPLGSFTDVGYDVVVPDFPYLSGETGTISALGRRVRTAIRRDRAALAEGRLFRDSNGSQMANLLLTKMAMEATDPWQKAILERGCAESEMNEDRHALSLYLDGYDSRLDEVLAEGFYDENGNGVYYGWLGQALDNALEYNLMKELVVEDGEITGRSMDKLWSAVGEAGERAKADFARPEMLEAIRRRLFATPIEETDDPARLLETEFYMDFSGLDISMDQLAILMYAVEAGEVSTEAGPDDITVTFRGPDPEKMIAEAGRKVMERLSALSAEQRSELPGLEEQFLLALAEYAVAARGKPETTVVAHGSAVDLARGRRPAEYAEYLEKYRVNAAIERLREQAGSLPEQPVLPLPSNGILTGGRNGTQVNVKLNPGQNPTYVQFRKADTEEMAASVFVHPGKTVELHLPKGQYYVYFCSGPYWGGEEDLFGSTGQYSKSELFEVKGSQYVHTLTLENVPDGGIGVYGTDPENFKKK